MTTLFYKALSQADKIPMIHQASQWLPFNNNTTKEEQIEVEYNLSSPRYSIAPPPYEKVVNEEKKNFLSSIWKRASFSSSCNEEEETLLQINEKVDKQMVDHAITLIQVATEMKNREGNTQNQQMAVDLYMMGLDKLITALPMDYDPCIRVTLERKLIELKDRYQFNLVSIQDLLNEQEQEDDMKKNHPIRSQLSDLVIQAAVVGAVALKKSPIPDAASKMMNFAMQVDEKHQIRKRTWDMASVGISKAIEIDRQYEIHQMVTGAVYTGLTAFIKAGLAYSETPTN